MLVLCLLCDFAAEAWFAFKDIDSMIVLYLGNSRGRFLSFVSDLERRRRLRPFMFSHWLFINDCPVLTHATCMDHSDSPSA